MYFRVIEGEAPGLRYFRFVRLLSVAIAFMIFAPALLLISFALFVLLSLVDPSVSQSLTDMSAGYRLQGAVLMGAITLPLLLLGRRFVLGRRRVVLFLRRFGAVGGLEIVTAAAGGSLGFGLRLVTLDDRSTPAVGLRATLIVESEPDLESALASVRRMSRRLTGPTRLFLRVADPAWQAVVLRLAKESDAVLIDVSEPGRNLLWEIEAVGPLVRPRWILVGEATALRRVSEGALDEPRADIRRLAYLLRGEEVLAYRRGRSTKPFRRALQGRYARVMRLRAGSGLSPAGTVSAFAGPPDPTTLPPLPPLPPARSLAPALSLPPARSLPPAPTPSLASPPWWPGRDIGLPARGVGSLASIPRRVGARAIDACLLLAALATLNEAVTAVRDLTGRAAPPEGDTFVSVTLVLLVAGFDPLTTRLFGATPGKRSLGIRVVSRPTRRPAPAVLVGLRGLIQSVLWLAVIPGVLDAAAAVGDPNRQAWHDRVTGTLVVRTERNLPRGPSPSDR